MKSIVLLGLAAAVLAGCKAPKCSEVESDVYFTRFRFGLIDQRINTSFWQGKDPKRYHCDSVQVFDESGTRMYSTCEQDRIGFVFLDEDKDAPTSAQAVTKTYLVRFNPADTDTLKITFRLFLDECGQPQLQSVTPVYNGKAYPQGTEVEFLK